MLPWTTEQIWEIVQNNKSASDNDLIKWVQENIGHYVPKSKVGSPVGIQTVQMMAGPQKKSLLLKVLFQTHTVVMEMDGFNDSNAYLVRFTLEQSYGYSVSHGPKSGLFDWDVIAAPSKNRARQIFNICQQCHGKGAFFREEKIGKLYESILTVCGCKK